MHVFLSWEEGFVEWGLRTRNPLNPIAFLLARFVYMYRYRSLDLGSLRNAEKITDTQTLGKYVEWLIFIVSNLCYNGVVCRSVLTMELYCVHTITEWVAGAY